MRHIIIIISICCFLFLVGCSQVVSKYPIGIENYIASSDAWDGIWLSEDEFIKIKVIDESNGIIKIAWIEQSENEFNLATITCQIKKGKKWLYFNVLELPGVEEDGYYHWGKIKKENHEIIFWYPSVEAFHEASKSKKLNTIVEKTTSGNSKKQSIKKIKLNDNPKAIIDLIEDSSSEYFDWENPVIVMKLKR